MIAIVDYKAGNLTSVRLAFDALKAETVVTRDPAVVRSAERVVFPGVGAAASAMANLRELGLEDAVKEAAVSGKPFLGICLGMQILFEHSEEDGGVGTLGVVPGRVRRFPDVPGFKVPEIGWNQVEASPAATKGESDRQPAAGGLRGEYYFVHSYYAELSPYTAGTTEYAGVKFTAMVKKGNLWATQFQPEKSGRLGLELIKEWLAC